jgi:hypothetical protein
MSPRIIVAAVGLWLVAAPGGAFIAAQAPSSSRNAITARLAELRKIYTPDGIESLEQVTLGGVPSVAGHSRWPRIPHDAAGMGVSGAVGRVLHGRPVGSAWRGQKRCDSLT